MIHSSTNQEEAEREIKLWFEPDDVIVDVYPVKEVELKSCKKKVWSEGR